MRPLIQHDASACRQLMFHARPVHELVVVPRVDHAKLAQLAALDDLTDFADRRIKAVRVAAKKLYAVFFSRRVHGLALFERERHGLFYDDVFFVLGRSNRVLRMELIGRRNVNKVDIGTLAHFIDRRENLAMVLFAKLC